MKFTKTLIATAALGIASAPVLADPTVYGKVNVSVQNSDDGTESISEMKSNSSRLGIKGGYKLKNGLSVVYQYELQVDVADKSGSDNLKSRSQFIGLKGGFGEVLLGRYDTALKKSQAKVDLFSDLNGDIKKLWKGENRMSNSVTYKTPKFNQFQFGLTYILNEDPDISDTPTSFSATYGDASLKKNKYYVALAMDNAVKGYDTQRVTFATKVKKVKLGAMYQSQEDIETGKDKSGFMLSAGYPMGAYLLKGQYQTLEDDSGLSIGVDRKLGSKTKAFVFYTSFNFDQGVDESYAGIGLEQKF